MHKIVEIRLNLTYPLIDILKWKIYDPIVYFKAENVEPFQLLQYEITPHFYTVCIIPYTLT
jgi:hypothetical protein